MNIFWENIASFIRSGWSILTKSKKGYSRHPETLRWKGKLKALYLRHDLLVLEMARRDYRHKTPLVKRLSKGNSRQTVFVNTKREQIQILKKKKCDCLLN